MRPRPCPAGFSTGFLCLQSAQAISFLAGVLTLGVVHHTLTVKGSHLASHNALTESKSWGKVWAIFFIEVSGAGGSGGSTPQKIHQHLASTPDPSGTATREQDGSKPFLIHVQES